MGFDCLPRSSPGYNQRWENHLQAWLRNGKPGTQYPSYANFCFPYRVNLQAIHCVAILSLQGKISLDDDIRKHIKELPKYEKPITIRHLVHHTSGIRDYLTLSDIAALPNDYFYTPEDSVELLSRQKGFNFLPGEEHLYSLSGYFLLGVIVERASGKSLNDFAQTHIFKPLGMKNTHFHDDHTMVVKNRADGYSPTKKRIPDRHDHS